MVKADYEKYIEQFLGNCCDSAYDVICHKLRNQEPVDLAILQQIKRKTTLTEPDKRFLNNLLETAIMNEDKDVLTELTEPDMIGLLDLTKLFVTILRLKDSKVLDLLKEKFGEELGNMLERMLGEKESAKQRGTPLQKKAFPGHTLS